MAPTPKSEYVSRTIAAINQQAVKMLTDQLADYAVEADRLRAEIERLKAENALLNAQLADIRVPQDHSIPV